LRKHGLILGGPVLAFGFQQVSGAAGQPLKKGLLELVRQALK
jgi:hypothetical protein